VDNAPLTVVGSEPEAELVCSMLRSEGIECFYKRSESSAAVGSLGAAGGATEVWVKESDLEGAEALLSSLRSPEEGD
jgi:hypothetical protein